MTRKIYVTDGTPAGFFTAAFTAYKDAAAKIVSGGTRQTGLFDMPVTVKTDREKAARVVKKLRELDRPALFEIDCILRTPKDEKEQIAFEYLRLIVQKGSAAREMLSFPTVRRAIDLVAKVRRELEHLRGFLRFTETQNGGLYAPCTPDNDVVDLLAPHFLSRLKGNPFAIHDIRRGVAAVSDGESWELVQAKEAEITFSEREENFLALWKKYYKTVYIPARRHVKQMKGYMPVRYWAFMPETEGMDGDGSS